MMAWTGEEWETALLDGSEPPGLCIDVSTKYTLKWDLPSKPGAHGTPATFQGYETSRYTVTMQIWTDEQWEDYRDFEAWIRPAASKSKPAPMQLCHPLIGEVTVLFESLTPPKRDADGIGVYTMEFIEYFPPPPKGAPSVTAKQIAPQKNLLEQAKEIAQAAIKPPSTDP